MRGFMIGGAAGIVVTCVLGCGVNQARPRQADLKVITHGQAVDLAAHLAPGKYTVVDFYAAWCPPCRVLGPALERLAAAENDRLAVRKVDIVDWTMPVVEQYGIESLPHLMLFAPDGRRMANGDGVYKALGDVFGDAAREVIEAGSATGSTPPPGAPLADDQGRQTL